MRGLGARFDFGLRGPADRIRGRDVAGVVEAVGAAVDTLRPGNEVYGELTSTFAESARAKASELSLKPAGLSFEEAAAVPLAGVTALQGMRDAGKVAPGQSVLINGASGGVGTFAVQIAKAYGAEVTAVCSGRPAGPRADDRRRQGQAGDRTAPIVWTRRVRRSTTSSRGTHAARL